MPVLDNLSRLPGSPQLHRWADWAELLCITSPDGALSLSDLADAIEQRHDYRDSEIDDDAEPGDLEAVDLAGDSQAETKDKHVSRAVAVFEYLEDRAAGYGDAYPFVLKASNRHLVLRRANAERDLYIFLLICASLRYVPESSVRGEFAARYEALCVIALRKHLPSHAVVRLFGKNAYFTSPYVGHITKKIDALAADMHETPRYSAQEFEAGDSGDNGLDIVAWLPTGDGAAGMVAIFGQCACTPKWIEKQHSSSYSAWKPLLSLMSPPVNMAFIPYDFRRPGSVWYKTASIHDSVVVDRRRLMSQLGGLGRTLSPSTRSVVLETIDQGLLRKVRDWTLHVV